MNEHVVTRLRERSIFLEASISVTSHSFVPEINNDGLDPLQS